MRRFGIWLLVCGLLWSCKREPSFDDRYDAAKDEIDRKARAIDAEIVKRAKDASPVETGDADVVQLQPQANPSN